MNQKYRQQPVTENDTVKRVETMWPNDYGPKWNINNYSDPMPCYPDSDESDSDEMLPLGVFRPTLDRLHETRDKLDRSGMCCKQLDYIDWNVTQYDTERRMSERRVTEVNRLKTVDRDTRSEVSPIRRNEATQNDSSPSRNGNGPQSHRLMSEPVFDKC